MDAVGCVLLTSRWMRKRRDSLLLVQPHILKVRPSLQTAPALRDHIFRPRQDIFHSKHKRRWQEIGSCCEDVLLKMLILTNCTIGSSRGCQSNSHECDRLVWQDIGWPSSSELGTVYNPTPTPAHTHSYTHICCGLPTVILYRWTWNCKLCLKNQFFAGYFPGVLLLFCFSKKKEKVSSWLANPWGFLRMFL